VAGVVHFQATDIDRALGGKLNLGVAVKQVCTKTRSTNKKLLRR
jgi:hypothetical protein